MSGRIANSGAMDDLLPPERAGEIVREPSRASAETLTMVPAVQIIAPCHPTAAGGPPPQHCIAQEVFRLAITAESAP